VQSIFEEQWQNERPECAQQAAHRNRPGGRTGPEAAQLAPAAAELPGKRAINALKANGFPEILQPISE
jgi:hypothetical protein